MARLFLVLALLSAAGPLDAQSVTRPRILGVAHIALRVSDVDRSRAFYEDFLGYGEPYQLNNPDGSLSLASRGGPVPDRVSRARIGVATRPGKRLC